MPIKKKQIKEAVRVAKFANKEKKKASGTRVITTLRAYINVSIYALLFKPDPLSVKKGFIKRETAFTEKKLG